MDTRLNSLRAVMTQPEEDFGKLMGEVLSPSRPLQSEEYLKGRSEHISGIKRALFQPGRHVLIHGLRGVGKSSLAQTVGYSQSQKMDPIIVSCDENSTFNSLVREIYDEAENLHPSISKKVSEFGGGFSRFGITANGKRSIEETSPNDPSSVNDAIRMVRFLTEHFSQIPIIIVDEFDQICDKAQQSHFANLIKQISDRHVSAKFIVCGIGKSASDIMEAHASADRYFHTVDLGQLSWEARFEIVDEAAKTLGIISDWDTIIRIARISDGFPHYVHFISEMLFWRIFTAENGGKMTPALFENAMTDASNAMDMKLRGPYETATQKYSDDYESVLWAAADGHEFVRRSQDVFESYERITQDLGKVPISRATFNNRMNRLKSPAHGEILTGNRQGWYQFTEKMIRGYVRLRAEQNKIDLDLDHPQRPAQT